MGNAGTTQTGGARSSQRAVRSLVQLEANASTSRVLNLIGVWKRNRTDAGYAERPFFANPALNRSIIVKHRLRADERRLFEDGRSVSTKVILPIDITNLRSGAHSLFVNQTGYDPIINDIVGADGPTAAVDRRLLEIIDELPTLDPFLMREHLRRCGFEPSRCYFEISQADMARITQFSVQEVIPLIGKLSEGGALAIQDGAAKLAAMMMASKGGEEFEPLRRGLSMDKRAFDEGLFCWKGFIYYKWMLHELLPKIRPVMDEISRLQPTGAVSGEDNRYIQVTTDKVLKSIQVACETVRLTLKIYDDAFVDLTRNGQPKAFREFLLNAPGLFFELGERLGAVEHIVSFWRYRFPVGRPRRVDADELIDLLTDFENNISFTANRTAG